MLSRARKAGFEPGVSFHFSKTGRIVKDHSSMKTLLVAMSNSTILVEFCTLILVYVYVLGSVTKCFFSPLPPSLEKCGHERNQLHSGLL